MVMEWFRDFIGKGIREKGLSEWDVGQERVEVEDSCSCAVSLFHACTNVTRNLLAARQRTSCRALTAVTVEVWRNR